METKDKIRVFHAMMSKMGVMSNKYDILASYGVGSTKHLSDQQLNEVIDRLQAMMEARNTTDPAIRHWRSVILSLLNNYGIYVDNNDWSRVNAFLMDNRIAGKLLYEMNVKEMTALARKLRAIIEKKRQPKGEYTFYGLSVN